MKYRIRINCTMVVVKCSSNGFIAVICNEVLRVYNIKDSKLVHTFLFCNDTATKSAEIEDEDKQFSNTTFCHGCEFSRSGRFLAVFSDNKELVVWQIKEWKIVGKRKVPKRPTAVLFTNQEDFVLISDKTGDVYSYSISHENGLSCERLLLGHVSMILDMALSRDDRYIITADRDEKIRVSCFPNSHNIETFCLGHTEYVSIVKIMETLPDILVSASGDGTLRFWNFRLGRTIHVETFNGLWSNTSPPTVSCITCSKQNNIVFIGLKGTMELYAFEVALDEQIRYISSATMMLDGSPCSLTVDCNDCLWVIQSLKDQPVIVFEIKAETGVYKFNRLSSPNILRLLSTEGWHLIYDDLKHMPCFENLKKKEGYGTAEYYNRKRDRIKAKRKRDAGVQDKNSVTTKKIKT